MIASPSQFFKCLSDETRLRSTLLIHQHGELCVCELMTALEESQPKISRHLSQLRACGVLSDTRRGQWVYYALSPDLPAWAGEILQTAVGAHAHMLKTLTLNLNNMDNRPEACAN